MQRKAKAGWSRLKKKSGLQSQHFGRPRQEDYLSPGVQGCREPWSHHCLQNSMWATNRNFIFLLKNKTNSMCRYLRTHNCLEPCAVLQDGWNTQLRNEAGEIVRDHIIESICPLVWGRVGMGRFISWVIAGTSRRERLQLEQKNKVA